MNRVAYLLRRSIQELVLLMSVTNDSSETIFMQYHTAKQ